MHAYDLGLDEHEFYQDEFGADGAVRRRPRRRRSDPPSWRQRSEERLATRAVDEDEGLAITDDPLPR